MRWISVKNSLPEYLQLVFIKRTDGNVYTGYRNYSGEIYSILNPTNIQYSVNDNNVSYWQPIVFPN